MKELSIEEKAKRYDEAIEIARDYHKQLLDEDNPEWASEIEKIFPELKESEDERISREITEFILTHRIDEPNDIEDTNSWLVWLEKQSEKDKLIKELGVYKVKYTQEVLSQQLEKQDEQERVNSPKFKVGDWIACEELNTALIVNINDDRYEVEFIDGNKGFPHIDYIDRLFHLWTIQDAKDGDILTSIWKGCSYIYIFKEVENNIIISHIFYYPELDAIDMGVINMDNTPTIPATKVQRDILFAKMHEAGYEWDANKKELTIIDTSLGPIDSKKKPIINHKEELLEFLDSILYKSKDANFDKYTKEDARKWIELVQSVTE